MADGDDEVDEVLTGLTAEPGRLAAAIDAAEALLRSARD
jgi:hypothetical protein